MACNFVEGSVLDCNDGISGIETFWVTEWANVGLNGSYTETSGTITAITQAANTKFWRVDLNPEDGFFDQNTTGSLVTPNFTTQILTFSKNKATAKLRNWLKVNKQNRLMILIKNNNGTYQMMGLTRGAYVPTVATKSGQKMGEFSGSTITFQANEPEEAPFVESPVVTGLTVGQ